MAQSVSHKQFSSLRRTEITFQITKDGQERAEQGGGEEVQGEREAGEGREGGEVEEDGGGEAGEREEEERDRGGERANKKHGRPAQRDGQAQSQLWSTSFREEILVSFCEKCVVEDVHCVTIKDIQFFCVLVQTYLHR